VDEERDSKYLSDRKRTEISLMDRLHYFVINLSQTFIYQKEIIFLIYDNSPCREDIESQWGTKEHEQL
jgi:hypothetical protein